MELNTKIDIKLIFLDLGVFTWSEDEVDDGSELLVVSFFTGQLK
jgi:hypothetical protein